MTITTDMLLLGLAALVLLCVILLIVVIIKTGSTGRRSARLLRDQLGQQRDEQLRSFQQMNDGLYQTFSNVSRMQNEQVNAVIEQSFDSAQALEHRLQYAQQATEDKLKRMETRVYSLEESVGRSLQQNETRIELMRKTLDENLRLLRQDQEKKLNEIRATVDEKLNETLERRLTSSFSQVSERLEQVYRSLGEVHSLANGVGDLKRMLSNVKTRGVWGEMQLGVLLEEALTENQYDKNVAVIPHANERVEFAIRLPGREDSGSPVYLPIDSKFPQEDYIRLVDAAESGEQQAVENAQKALLQAVRTEAKRIGKYIAPPHTTDFAVMFLPLEGLYAEVMRHADMVEAIQREQRILIAGPSTLLALLNSLQMGFRTLAIEKRSAEVWKLLGAVKNDFGSFALLLEKTQEKLQQASHSIDSAFSKTKAIEKRLRNVETMDNPHNASNVLAEE